MGIPAGERLLVPNMRTSIIVALVGGTATIIAQVAGPQPAPLVPLESVSVLAEGADYRVIQRVWQFTDESGQVSIRTNRFTALASGLQRVDPATGRYVPCEALFEQAQDGFIIARRTAHQVILSPDIATPAGAVDMLVPTGERLVSSPLGIAALDVASGKAFMIASVTNSQALLVSPTEVLYAGCFDGLDADIRYTLALDRFEQDVILHQPIPPEWLTEQGLDPDTTRVLVLTEFLDPPDPIVSVRTSAQIEGIDVIDHDVRFGSMELGLGRAFTAGVEGAEALPPVLSSKAWDNLGGRRCLVESVGYPELKPLLDTLPLPAQARVQTGRDVSKATAATTARANVREDSALASILPARPASRKYAQRTRPTFDHGRLVAAEPIVLMAQNQPGPRKAAPAKRGVVWDYAILASATTLVLQGDTTYLLTNNVNVSNLTIEGGAVIKYNTNGPKLTVTSGVTCKTSMFKPAVFCGIYDSSVGESIATSTNPPAYYANPALDIAIYIVTLQHLRIVQAQVGVLFEAQAVANNNNVLRHVQFLNCQTAVKANGYSAAYQNNVYAGNILMAGSPTCFDGLLYNGSVDNLTVNNATYLAKVTSTNTATLGVTNSILANVTNLVSGSVTLTGNYNGFYNSPQFGNVPWSSSSFPFQSAGAGSYYLNAGSPFLGVATPSTEATTLSDLRQMTVFPPVVTANCYLPGSVTLFPQAERNSGSLHLGWHYPPIDYLYHQVAVTNATVTVLPGTVIGVYGTSSDYGLGLFAAASLICTGTPTALVRVVGHNTVQEQNTGSWAACGDVTSVITSWNADSPAPAASFRFTGWSRLAAAGIHFFGDSGVSFNVPMSDNQFSGAQLTSWWPGLKVSNCLFERVFVDLEDWGGDMSPTFSNNLLRGGTLYLSRSMNGTWTFTDNYFDKTTISQNGSVVTHNYNAYVTNYTRLTNNAPNDVILTASLAFQSAALGSYYQPTNSALINAGSKTNAALAGLYYHTTTANQVQEGTSVLDIGFHYIAVDGNGNPVDSDGDTCPDYIEDANASGTLDSGETKTNDANDWGLKVIITRPKGSAPLP